ncbi:MAG: extracellular solute-binding protein [Propionibacteriaceae bacterium]|jgi:arabinogalactan oligomer/maltooligosaccharide transport system substrate-binding protein|nr:extracellular solute-binding protein [Propionibacteriaceae bacterium]
MKKKALLIAAMAGALALSACASGGDAQPSGQSTGGGEVQEVTLTVWGPQADLENATSWLPKQMEAFAAAHPEYKITWKQAVVGEDKAADTVKQDAASAADVYMFANDQLGQLIQSSAIGTLPSNVVEQVKSQNSDVMVTSVTGPDGSIYGVPYTANTWFMYYDKSKFSEEDVKSLDTMLEKGKVSFPLDTAWYLPAFYVGNGCTFFGPDGTDEAAGIDFTGDKAAKVTEYLVALAKNKNFINDVDGAGLAAIQNGKASALFSGTWDAEKVKEALGDNFGAAALPSYNLNGQSIQMKAFAGSKAAGFNPNSKFPKAAAEFAAYLGSADAQAEHYSMRNVIPTDKSLAADAAIAADPVASAQMAVVNSTSILQPTVTKMGNFWDPAATFGKAIINGDVTAKNAAEKTEAWNKSMNA